MKLLTTFIIVLLILLYFYRYPKLNPIIFNKKSINNVYGPAFGTVLKIIKNNNNLFISIFLSPLDIHYQFFPIFGQLEDIKYDKTGKFALAYELNKSNDNEKAIYTLSNTHGEFKVYQIAGKYVKRISIYIKEGQEFPILVDPNRCMGMIHFGSRVDIEIPKADKFNLLVKEGDYINGPNTLLGNY